MRSNRKAAIILVLAVIFFVLTASVLIACGTDHVCHEEGCTVCACLSLVSEICATLALALASAMLIDAAAVLIIRGFRDTGAAFERLTPTVLKVKLLN